MYIVTTYNKDWVDDPYARDVMGYSLVSAVGLNILTNFFFLFRTIYFGYQEKVFRKRGKANKCAVRICKICSPKIRQSEKLWKERKIKR
jgi:hypothetical protein